MKHRDVLMWSRALVDDCVYFAAVCMVSDCPDDNQARYRFCDLRPGHTPDSKRHGGVVGGRCDLVLFPMRRMALVALEIAYTKRIAQEDADHHNPQWQFD